MKVWLFFVLFASAILAQGFALECFVCADCHSPFDRAAHKQVQCTNDNLFPVDPVTTTTVAPTAPTTTPEDTTTVSTPPPTTAPPSTVSPTTDATTDVTTPEVPSTDTTSTTTSTTPPPNSDGPPTPPQTTGPPVTTARFRRAVRAADSEFRCFVTEIENTTRRGCTRWKAGDTQTCSAIGGKNCRVCNETGCNSGTSLVASFAAILLAVCVALRVM